MRRFIFTLRQHFTAYRQNIVIYPKGNLFDVDTNSERASSSITPQVLMTTYTKISVSPIASRRWIKM
jgi:hypothetical protein|tara:strand:- start:493 stop:693 length:201 start_codon:yes stop_codon:yes gene_type:complete